MGAHNAIKPWERISQYAPMHCDLHATKSGSQNHCNDHEETSLKVAYPLTPPLHTHTSPHSITLHPPVPPVMARLPRVRDESPVGVLLRAMDGAEVTTLPTWAACVRPGVSG